MLAVPCVVGRGGIECLVLCEQFFLFLYLLPDIEDVRFLVVPFPGKFYPGRFIVFYKILAGTLGDVSVVAQHFKNIGTHSYCCIKGLPVYELYVKVH